MKTIKKCIICGKIIDNRSDEHNAEPVKEGICCSNCNEKEVIPKRVLEYHFKQLAEERDTSINEQVESNMPYREGDE